MDEFQRITPAQIETVVNDYIQRERVLDSVVAPDSPTKNKSEHKKKEYESFALKNFIALYDPSITIVENREKPDFHIRCKEKNVGIEVTSLSPKKKQTRVINIQRLFQRVENILRDRFPSHTRLINCNIKDDLMDVADKNIDNYSNEIANILNDEVKISEPYSFRHYPNNIFFDEVYSMRHTQLNINPDFGVTKSDDADMDEINKIIKKKNDKNYKANSTFDEIWLIIYVDSSDKMGRRTLEDTIVNDRNLMISNNFDKVFIYNSFGKCYDLK